MKRIELNYDDVIHLLRGGSLEHESFEVVVRKIDLKSTREIIPQSNRIDEPCPPFKSIIGGGR